MASWLSDLLLKASNHAVNRIKKRIEKPAKVSWKRQLAASAGAEPDNKICILLNDTAALAHHKHLGCNAVNAILRRRLKAAGRSVAVAINSLGQAQKEIGTLRNVALVLMNGEGSVHHDNGRVAGLMDFAGLAHEAGIPTALINTVWQANSSVLGRRLKYFDLVAVRESRSLKAISRWREDVRLVPDLSIAAFLSGEMKRRSRNSGCATSSIELAVIDSVRANITKKLSDFATHEDALMLFMGDKHDKIMRQALLERPDRAPLMKKFETLEDLYRVRACVSGRFHGTIAALCSGLPVLATPSNTWKTQAMMEDAGIAEIAMLPSSWMSMSMEKKDEEVRRRMQAWGEEQDHNVHGYLRAAQADIDILLNDLVAMAL